MMKRFAVVAAVVLALSAGVAHAFKPYYGSTTTHTVSYKHSAPVAAAPYAAPVYSAPVGYSYGYAAPTYAAPTYAAPSYGYAAPTYAAPSYGYAAPTYAAPSYGYAAPSYAIAPSGGCYGSGAGYGLSYGATGFAGYGYPSAGYGYGYGYAAPQAGFPFPGATVGTVLDSLRLIKEVVKEVEGLRPESKIDDSVKKDIEDLKKEVKSLRGDFNAASLPKDLDKHLGELQKAIQDTNLDLQRIEKVLIEKNILPKK